MEEEWAEKTIEAEEGVLLEVGTKTVLQILVLEVKIKIPVSQVVRYLINRIFSSITVKSMDIIHMNAGKDSIIRTSEVDISQTTKILPLVLCLWCALKRCL
jgi:hypothetical protein